MTTDNLTALDEAERLIAAEAQARREEIQSRRAALTAQADEARREAARARLADLNSNVIPGNETRAAEATAALAAVVGSGSDPFVEALVTIVETTLARHALHSEASSLEATIGQPSRHVPMQVASDISALIADAILTAAQQRVPARLTLPAPGTPPETHEQAMERERLRHHHDRMLHDFLGLGAEQVASMSAEEYPAKVREAEAERERRQAEANANVRHDEINRTREPGFRTVKGA